MLLRTAVALLTFVSVSAFAGQSGNDLFAVRSYVNPNTKAKIPVDGKLFANPDDLKSLALNLDALSRDAKTDTGPLWWTAQVLPTDRSCSIPLLGVKTPKTHDNIANFQRPAPQESHSAGTIPPPVPACKNWISSNEAPAGSGHGQLRRH